MSKIPPEIIPESVVWTLICGLLVALINIINNRIHKERDVGKAAAETFWRTMNDVLQQSKIRNQNNPFADSDKRQIRAYDGFRPHVGWRKRKAFTNKWEKYYDEGNKFFDDYLFGSNPEQTTERIRLFQKQIESLMEYAK